MIKCNVIPKICQYVKSDGKAFRFDSATGIDYGDFEPWCAKAFLERTGLGPGGNAGITLRRNISMECEAYRLLISQEHITIYAAAEQGIIHALTTLAQMIENHQVQACKIQDAPKYEHRGLSMDCARHFFPAEEIKKVIEEISLAKMNVFHWHLTDDQGWRIESKKFPLLHTKSLAYYTQDEIRDICEYARVRGVKVIPEIDMPGHVSSLLSAYPEYSCSGREVPPASGGGIYPVILCAGSEKTYAFLNELCSELCELFPGKYFHTGGDEAPKKEWKKCPACQKKMAEMGYSDYEQLQGYFAGRIAEILKKQGKVPIYWNETLRSTNAPNDVQIQYWMLQHRESMERFADQGGKWVYSDMFELYFDYPYSMTSLKKVYETVPHLGEREVTKEDGLVGMEGAVWAEHIRDCTRLENLLFPRAYALAEILWSGQGDYKEFEHRLEQAIQTKLHKDIAYTDQSWWNPVGEARQREAFGYMKAMNEGMSDETKAETVESTAPNKEFGEAFMKKFFQPEDLPILMAGMKG